MEAKTYNTTVFHDVFSDYNSFKEWYTSLPLSDSEEDVPTEKTFALISYEYNDSHIAFTADGFKQHFAIDIYTYYKEFEKTSKAIDDLMNLTSEDISIADSVITNNAEIPEEERSTDTETVDFISAQQKMITKKGKLQVSRELLANKRAYTVRTFIGRFKHLFVKVIDPAYVFMIENDEY